MTEKYEIWTHWKCDRCRVTGRNPGDGFCWCCGTMDVTVVARPSVRLGVDDVLPEPASGEL